MGRLLPKDLHPFNSLNNIIELKNLLSELNNQSFERSFERDLSQPGFQKKIFSSYNKVYKNFFSRSCHFLFNGKELNFSLLQLNSYFFKKKEINEMDCCTDYWYICVKERRIDTPEDYNVLQEVWGSVLSRRTNFLLKNHLQTLEKQILYYRRLLLKKTSETVEKKEENIKMFVEFLNLYRQDFLESLITRELLVFVYTKIPTNFSTKLDLFESVVSIDSANFSILYQLLALEEEIYHSYNDSAK